MVTYTADELAAIPGAISSAELLSEAVRTNKKQKYYVLDKTKYIILTRYVTPKQRYEGIFWYGVPRFTNYWHAYAYQQRLIQQKEDATW